jgi:hypothetical protein
MAAAGKTMTNRATLMTLGVVFVGLIALTIWQTNRDQATAEPAPAPTGTFQRVYPEMAVLDIQAIRLEHPGSGDSFTISRAPDGTWTAPGTAGNLDAEEASNIAKTVVLLPYERTLPLTDDTDLGSFGFEPGARLLVSVLLNNQEQHGLAVGNLTPTREDYYTLIDEREALYLIKRGAIDFLIVNLVSPPVS